MRVLQDMTLYQLTFLGSINCYLVEDKDELTLVDAALPNSAKGILQAAGRIGKPITRIVLTHAHQDHVGALDALKRALPEAVVYISRRDARLLAGDVSLDPGEPDTPIRGGVPKGVETTPDVLLEDGDRVGSLLAVASPGHTPGSMSFIDTRNNELIAGDAFQTLGGLAVSGRIRPLFPLPAMATWNKEVALKSARKLLGQDPSLLAIGHGRMLRNPAEGIGRAIQEMDHSLERTADRTPAGRGM